MITSFLLLATLINTLTKPPVVTHQPSPDPNPFLEHPETEVITLERTPTPQVWSDHKLLSITTEQCAEKAVDILVTLDFKQTIIKDTNVYGNYLNNRAAIKCTDVNGQTLVYAIVAGPKVKLVERLRNEIIWAF